MDGANDDDVRPPITLANAFAHSNSVNALIWASVCGWLLATSLAVGQRILTLNEAMGAWVAGVAEVVEPILVLVFAWGLGDVIASVHTAAYLSQALTKGAREHVHLLPHTRTPCLTSHAHPSVSPQACRSTGCHH
jgi:Na+/H+ antiporter NhaC